MAISKAEQPPLVVSSEETIACARALIDAGNVGGALEMLREAQRTQNRLPLLDYEWRVLNSLGRISAVGALATQLKTEFPQFPNGWIASCWYLWRSEQIEACVCEAEALIASFPRVFEGYFFVINALKSFRRLTEVEAIARQTAERFPDRAWVRVALAQILDESDRLKEAVDVLETALGAGCDAGEIAPTYLDLKIKLSPTPISSEWQQMLEVASATPLAANTLARAIFRRVRPHEATEYVRQLVERFPNDSDVLEIAARHYVTIGDAGSAVGFVADLAGSSSGSLRSFRAIAELLLSQHKWRELKSHLDRHADLITREALDTDSSCITIEAMWACAHNHCKSAIGFEAIRFIDKRITKAVSVFLTGNPFSASLEWLNPGAKLPVVATYFRAHSFAHPTWQRPVAGYDCRTVIQYVLDAFLAGLPFSLVRLGDGEGSFLAREPAMRHLGGATMRVARSGNAEIPLLDDSTYDEIRESMLAAITGCNVLGVPNEFSCAVEPKYRYCFDVIAREACSRSFVLADNCVHYGIAKTGLLERLAALQVLGARQIYYVRTSPSPGVCWRVPPQQQNDTYTDSPGSLIL
jgi:tetratricopeptide (TPR) repeat protein